MKRQASGLEKMFANHIFNKRLVFRIYKELSNPTIKTPIKKRTKGLAGVVQLARLCPVH